MNRTWEILTGSFKSWRRHNPAFLAAGISYYAVFSIVPGLIITLAVMGHLFRKSQMQAVFLGGLASLFNSDVAVSIQTLLRSGQKAAGTATVFGILLLVWAASHMFASLQHVLNIVWEVPDKNFGIKHFLVGRFKAFAMIVIFCGAMAVFLSLDIGLAFIKHHLPQYVPRLLVRFFIQAASYSLYLSLFTVLFAMIFKFFPQTRVAWRDVWTGAFFTAVMFTLARTILALYFSFRVIGSFYGAAGSVIVLMVWIYFSTQIFLFGAEFTHAYGDRT